MKQPFELLLISPEHHTTDEVATLIQLFAAGLETYHLRKPLWSTDELKQFLLQIPFEFLPNIVLHSRFELTKVFNLKGIHLNEDNKKHISQLQEYKIISTSFHALQHIKKNIFSYEYVFLSPIFNSISKTGYTSKFDLPTLTKDLNALHQQNAQPKIIALGGINAENILIAKQSGFSGAAVLGAVWQSENPVQAFLEIQSKIKGG